MNQEFYRFRCEAGDEPTAAELLIFAAIGDWEELGEVSAKAFARDLAKLPTSVKRLDIHINSPGGSLSEAQAMYSRLADHRSEKVVYVDGLVASAATIVAMVGHKIYIRANANMMIHLPSGIVMGNADDMRKMIAALDSMTESMVNVYAKRTGQQREDIHNWLAEETWFTAHQAVENGFADEVRGVVKAAAMVSSNRAIFNGTEFDLSRFHNIPAFIAKPTTETKTQMKRKVTANAEEEKEEENGNGGGEKETPTPPAKEETPAPPAKEEPNPAVAAPATKPSSEPSDAAIAVERARVSALLDLDRPATHAIITAAIKDGRQVTDVIKDVMAAMDKVATQQARRTDASALNGIPPSDGADGKQGFGTLVKDKVQARLKKRVRISRS